MEEISENILTTVSCQQGKEASVGPSVPADVVNNARKNTPFSYDEALKILQRYGAYDVSSKGSKGLTVTECILIPEFSGNPFASDVTAFHVDPESKKIHPRNFMKICQLFYRETPAKTKKQFLFDLFHVDKQKVLTHDAMFRIYKLLFSHAISDDHILALTFSALRHPYLTKDGEVGREKFLEMIPDSEIQEKFSIDFFSDEPCAGTIIGIWPWYLPTKECT